MVEQLTNLTFCHLVPISEVPGLSTEVVFTNMDQAQPKISLKFTRNGSAYLWLNLVFTKLGYFVFLIK